MPSSQSTMPQPVTVTSQEVIQKIENLAASIIDTLDRDVMPVLEYTPQSESGDEEQDSGDSDDGDEEQDSEDSDYGDEEQDSEDSDDGDEEQDSEDSDDEPNIDQEQPPSQFIAKGFELTQCRSFTSIILVLSYCHNLLLSNCTTTIREVYYFYITHFRSQKECDLAIWDAAELLQVPRLSLGVKASARGWFMGDVQLVRKSDGHMLMDARHQQSVQGSPISHEWLRPELDFTIHSDNAECILVIEKEGIYFRLCEDRFFDQYPCIVATGRGFPDLATRACVWHMHQALGIPAWGLADCDPFGVMVLHTFQFASNRRRGVDGGDRYSVPIKWLGLRPSQIRELSAPDGHCSQGSALSLESQRSHLPPEVFQELTELDQKRLQDHLLQEGHRWTNTPEGTQRALELHDMHAYKVELEALHWLGMEFTSLWLGEIFEYQRKLASGEDEGKEWLKVL